MLGGTILHLSISFIEIILVIVLTGILSTTLITVLSTVRLTHLGMECMVDLDIGITCIDHGDTEVSMVTEVTTEVMEGIMVNTTEGMVDTTEVMVDTIVPNFKMRDMETQTSLI